MSERRVIKFKPYKPPVFDASYLVYGKKREDPPIRTMAKLCSNCLYGYIEPIHPIPIKQTPLSLKLLARNVFLKHRPHKDWVEFCSYPKTFRDVLINPYMIGIITPQLQQEEHPA
jgi:predicted AlkP superfamily phosphohydrolase/phosphomutase